MATALTLVIGNKNYSSWSLRPWLALKHIGVPFKEVRIPLYSEPKYKEKILKYSPNGKVPCLLDGKLAVWESLAICEYLADKYPEAGLWPSDAAARAVARAVSCEMHAGFSALRNNMPMNVRRAAPGKGRTPESVMDIERIDALWNDCRDRFGVDGPFLFGRFSVADAMFAPVVIRFRTYRAKVSTASVKYMRAVERLPAMQEWIEASRAEKEVITNYEL